MPGVTIVALPAQDERVNDVSSEKAAHMTILYLGENVPAEEAATIIEFVAHASGDLDPFWAGVDYRGELGPDKADVLFFEVNEWDLGPVKEFRNNLLLNDTIRKAYNSVPQYEGWTPHLTLGFPETPAKDISGDEKRIHSVRFDRIAVWVEDSAGPEFRLKYESRGLNAVNDMAMSNNDDLVLLGKEAVEGLFHHGVKGMKWGVRNDKGHEGQRAKTKKIDKLDKKFEKDTNAPKTIFKVYNDAAKNFNKYDVARINNKPEYKGQDFRRDSPLRQKYYKEHQDAFIDRLDKAAGKLGTNASGTRKYTVVEAPDGSWFVNTMSTKPGASKTDNIMSEAEANAMVEAALKQSDFETMDNTLIHEDRSLSSVKVKVTYDDMGHIESIQDDNGEVKHYGVKGMRWGVTTVDKATKPTLQRENQTKVLNTKDVTVTQRRAGTYVKTRGGQRQKASDDAVKAHAGRQKAKKSTTDALTNDELKAVVERLRLEQEYAKLDSKVKRRGQGFIARLFQTPEGRQITADMAKRMAQAQN